MTTDGRKLRGQRSREAILDQAVSLASVDGLEGLTLGRLAAAAGVSKSGFFAHWTDKQHLQLDTIDWASRQWRERVVMPARTAAPGVRRLFALHEARLRFYTDRVLPGGCFFFAAQVEFDDRPGPVKEHLAQAVTFWLDYLRAQVERAVGLGELDRSVDPAQLAFEIDALGEAAVTCSRLVNQELAFVHSRRAVLQRLRALSTNPNLLPED
ncbi:TetR/AcrR family transcriptional regulator [Nonomuraea sediminis]|uniref:TetR/AcrR family transcriptional regulator n=1 Tax=Nonomuraea sediminis TaxID=2835864 RepID=UPI001BDC9E9C|nr:TetR/AcrR family transcriptional regulator [Nonomuraea sediminis]